MKIIFDNIVFAIQKFGGISVVWQELLERIAKNNKFETNYIDIDNSRFANYSRSKLSILSKDIICTVKYPRIERYMPVRLDYKEPFIFHSSYYRYCTNPNAINITTVHDFTYEFFVKGIKQKIHTWQKFSAIRHSDVVVCISENTKRDLLRLMPDVEERKVKVIYNGVSDSFRLLEGNIGSEELPFASHSYIVFIGRRDSYKNFEMVMRSVAATKYNLLIIGAQLSEQERIAIEQILPPTRFMCISHVSDDKLNVLYYHAAALAYPSSYEGFGLPVLEAQRAGCPVIALGASSIPEVIGKTPLLMRQLNVETMVSKLRLLADDQLVKQIRRDGMENAMRFSWERMAGQYLDLYQHFFDVK